MNQAVLNLQTTGRIWQGQNTYYNSNHYCLLSTITIFSICEGRSKQFVSPFVYEEHKSKWKKCND